jgi:hypothetical protein
MWQRVCNVVGGVLLLIGLLGALRSNHEEALAVSARITGGQWRKERSLAESRWLRHEERGFELSLGAIAVGVVLQTFAAAFAE